MKPLLCQQNLTHLQTWANVKQLIVRSLGIGIKKEDSKESGNGVDIYLYSCAALMVAALHRKKTVKMV